jgi:hypothetical protein
MRDVMGVVVVLAMIAAGIAVYLAPTIVANKRGHRNTGSIVATNILLGWTFIGWCVALIWSLSDNAEKPPAEAVSNAGARQNWE